MSPARLEGESYDRSIKREAEDYKTVLKIYKRHGVAGAGSHCELHRRT